ncbi:MAG TPA: PAS domain-containing sensor histidine kinase [Patescibacteria group bacterium]|nr:PAS domain-containing sensor histidine kinase [Patescibacteria group bacterium]
MLADNHTSQLIAFLLSLVKNSPYGIITMDFKGNVTIANSLAAEHIGFPLEDSLDRPILDFTQHLPELSDKIRQCIKTGRVEFVLPKVSNGERFIAFKAKIISDGMLITTEDITDKVESEEIKRLNSNLMAKNKKLGQYAYIVSHNLRAPVANIMGISDILVTGSAPPQMQETLFEKIRTSAHSLNEILTDLNEMLADDSLIQEMKQKLNLQEEFETVASSISQQIEDAGATITTDFKNVRHIHSLKSYLRSIFANLLTNSLKYKNPEKPLFVHISAEITKGGCAICFEDNGLGIDLKKYGDKIFGMYKRFHKNTDGKGLGLHLVKMQVEALGGNISVESAPLSGAKFTIFLEQ